ncbi:TetR/AcrR family transcriptional regulator [Streptomyces sp. IB201691-2A2]|uniref:TetR/AcrR family transcriptional regulator n=1 Tax=Streptomyces sp. IB201691-2A2 TaxID=2561920 RepID=UPI00117D7673|nr:TetR/AcrR family transcriptional regulator [Streptomyces sp. IB201691-2A2]TRO55534.1 TetR/AcrR family transcriptional regulator [Streptomyces sp. IB201691-2A2]
MTKDLGSQRIAGHRDRYPTHSPALRKDAERNRQRLLTAARTLFAERGFGVTLNDIAHQAGVGIGTAYRRFANKSEVIEALFESQVQEIITIADNALADPDPWNGLTTYLERCMDLQARDRGIVHILNGRWITAEQHDRLHARLANKVDAITDRAKSVGALRADVHGTDLVFMQLAVNTVLDRTRSVRPDLYRRYLHLFLEGIRDRPNSLSPLPVEALSSDDTHAVMAPDADA